ncbi:unnamed protein product [Prorocentrum cordatum]|uniref:Ion transport domain-containing protein n=1 Tax=Prorocentrum cordatum TaxID=2364126 RepID=A0ABN9XXL1_9DINO|nr:unnamed protein product [Polarella glacialis]
MGNRWASCFHTLEDFWMLEEPPRQGAFAQCVASNRFHALFALAVAANAGAMIYFTNEDIDNSKNGIMINERREEWRAIADAFFLVVFSIEAACKLAVHRWFYFWNQDAAWNWLDALLILQGALQLIVHSLRLDTIHGVSQSAACVRMFRLLKAARILRVMRVIKVFTELRLIFNMILGSIMYLFWSFVLFATVFLTFSMYFTSSVADHLHYLQVIGSTDIGDVQNKHVAALHEYFGSIGISMRSLFMAAFGGSDWGDVYFALNAMGGLVSDVFLFFIAFLQLSLLNIVTSCFVDRAMKISQPGALQLAEERIHQEREHAKELENLLSLADEDQNGFAEREALESLMKDGKIIHFLRRGVGSEYRPNVVEGALATDFR